MLGFEQMNISSSASTRESSNQGCCGSKKRSFKEAFPYATATEVVAADQVCKSMKRLKLSKS